LLVATFSGALSGVTTLDMAGNFTQTGATTFGTGTGAVSINGDLTMAANKNIVLSGTGKIGIGTVSPNENLEIFDDAGAYLRFSGIVGGVGEDAGGIEWYQSRGGTTGVISKFM